jgi:hypothetical protein
MQRTPVRPFRMLRALARIRSAAEVDRLAALDHRMSSELGIDAELAAAEDPNRLRRIRDARVGMALQAH